ncbi:MAG: UbiA family prenyltransferase [Planctomycetota bacterium]
MLPTAVQRLLTAASLLGMTRLGLVLSAVSGGWLMTYLAFAVEPAGHRNPELMKLGLGWALLASGLAAMGLGVCAIALNDVLDRRQDRAMARDGGGVDKPVAAGRVSPRTATAVAVAALLVAVLSAGVLGVTSFRLAVLLAAGVLFYNFAGRFLPGIGIVTLGLLHGLALAVPNPEAGFAWPVLLTMSHVMLCGLVRHAFEDKRPRLGGWGVWGVIVGWGFWSLVVLLLIGARRETGAAAVGGEVWIGPVSAVLGFVAFGRWAVSRGGRERFEVVLGRGRAVRFRRLSVGWLVVYDAAWLWSLGLWWQGFTVIGLLSLVVLAAGLAHDKQAAKGGFIDEFTGR